MRRKHKKNKRHIISGLNLAALLWSAAAFGAGPLEAGFQSPPQPARAQTWWHWMNGNITKEGITADLEAMKRVGLGGAQIFNVDCDIPAGPVKFNSAEWHELFKHAVKEANRLGLEICVMNGAGWSSSGGPWNRPEHGMQCVVTSERRVQGPSLFDGVLAQPPSKLGFYRDIAIQAFAADCPRHCIDNLDAKAGFNGGFVTSSTEKDAAGKAIARRSIVDLTGRLEAKGRLKWNVPPGDWIILRAGYTPTGQENHPAPAEGTGLECDKFSREALDAHWAGFVRELMEDAGPLAGKTFDNVLIDSYEVGGQNWSPGFRAEFKKRRGYDPLPLLPVFTGRVVDSPEISERFLWDMRRTIADLFAENYYGHFQELCHKSGLMASFEPYTGPFESLQCGRSADVVMGEFWGGTQGDPSVKLAASVAHIYGKAVVGAESFTSAPEAARWRQDPWSLKPLGDLMYCTGLNRYIFHRYAMQPWTNRWPGMTMGPWGLHFERTLTWWEQGKAWLDYVARCQFLLQQGRYVADAAYFCGENAPSEMPDINPPLPPGYQYDAINADALLHRARMRNGRLALPGGAAYSVLVLPQDEVDMTPKLLRRIGGFVRAGLTVVGCKPRHSPSLEHFPRCDVQVKSKADKLWGLCDGTNMTEHPVGRGRIVCGRTMAAVLAEQRLEPDFEFHGASPETRLVYCHRIAGEADIYFVSNQRREFALADCTFRVAGKRPELWRPDTGAMEPAPIWSEQEGRMTVKLQFEPAGSLFVIFRRPTGGEDHIIEARGPAAESAPAPAPKIEITQAVYEAEDGTGSMDVTDKVAELVRQGEIEIAASNDQFGRDPAFNHVKRLRVNYRFDGKAQTQTVEENAALTLPWNLMPEKPAPAWSLAGEGGRCWLRTSTNGSFEFRTAAGKLLRVAVSSVPEPIGLNEGWDLQFPPHWGAPPEIKLDKLISWTDHEDAGVRYFSGTAIYEKEVEIPSDFLRGDREIWLELGTVKNFAEVSLNGHLWATLWKPPFRVNLTGVAQPGKNRLQIKVTNLWPNRLIGDEQLPDDREWSGQRLQSWPQWLLEGKASPTGRLTFTTWHHWSKTDAPLSSGLLGPVRLAAWAKAPAE
jgi:hypothetical protein